MILKAARIRSFVALVAVVGALATVPAAGASLPADVAARLRADGIDPATAVIQRGARNYAGPSCPGVGWNCADTARPVVQIGSDAASSNVVECSGTSSGGNTCSVVQTSSGGDNLARCVLTTTDDDQTQTCSINQTNTTGSNDAYVEIRAEQVAGTEQINRQHAEVRQTGTTGASTATVIESIDLRASAVDVPAASTKQDGFQFALVDQDATSGDLFAAVTQNQYFRSIASAAGDVVQEQATLDDGFNLRAVLDQQNDDGDNTASLKQAMDFEQDATSASGTITGIQGSPSGGLRGDVDQDSATGFSDYTADLIKKWVLDPDATTALQLLDPRCCIFGIGATPHVCDITERVTLIGPAGADQSALLHGRAFAKEMCTLLQEVRIQKGTEQSMFTNRAQGTFFDEMVVCDAEGCREEEVVVPPQQVFLAVRNMSEGEQFHPVNLMSPHVTHADPGDRLEFKIAFITTERVTNLNMIDGIPDGVVFDSCSSACVGGGPDEGGFVTFFRRTGETTGPRTGRYIVRVGSETPLGSTIINDAFATSSAGTVFSNPVQIHIRLFPVGNIGGGGGGGGGGGD